MKTITRCFSTGLCWLVLSFFAGTVFFTGDTASAQSLTLTDLQPAAGGPGDQVQLRGHGFDGRAASYFAWTSDGERGFVFDVTKKISKQQLNAVVGEVHADVEGPVVLWRGRSSRVAPFKIDGGRFVVRKIVVFRPQVGVRGSSFAATAGTTPGFAGRLVDGVLRLDFPPPDPILPANLKFISSEEEQDADGDADGDVDGDGGGGDDDNPNRLTSIEGIIYDGSGESCGPPDGGSGDGGGSGYTAEGFGVSFRIECLDDRKRCRGNPAFLLAEAFKGLPGDLGLEAAVEGTTFVLSQSELFCGAAANVRMSPALAQGGSSAPQDGSLLASSSDRSSSASSS